MKRYMGVGLCGETESFEKKLREELNSNIWYLENRRPELPYVRLKIKIVEREKRYQKGSSTWMKTINLFGFEIVLKRRSKERG